MRYVSLNRSPQIIQKHYLLCFHEQRAQMISSCLIYSTLFFPFQSVLKYFQDLQFDRFRAWESISGHRFHQKVFMNENRIINQLSAIFAILRLKNPRIQENRDIVYFLYFIMWSDWIWNGTLFLACAVFKLYIKFYIECFQYISMELIGQHIFKLYISRIYYLHT